MITTVRGRNELRAATRAGSRISGAVLWCTWCPDPEASSTSVAYAIGRVYGSAVRRNRLRRRIRAVLADIDRRNPLPPGTMLIGVHRQVSTEVTFAQVQTDVNRIVSRAGAEHATVVQHAVAPCNV